MPLSPAVSRAFALALAALLYDGVPSPANADALPAELVSELRAGATGHMDKLVVHDASKAPIEAPFLNGEGDEVVLADFAGKVVLVNFWATWCPPCRAEMPSIDRLAQAMEAEPFEVVAISTDFGSASKSAAFLQEIGTKKLALYHDKSKKVAREAAVLGLPVTLLLDREGREVARLVGDAEWDSDDAKAVIAALIAATSPDGES